MDHERLARHRLGNLAQSLLLLGGLAVLMGVLGWIIGGPVTALVAVAAVFTLYWVNPAFSPRLVLGLYRARPIAPREAPSLVALVEELARRADLPRAPVLYYLPSDVLNAFAVGRQGSAAIALSDGLLRRLDLRELAGVLAHEISHIRHDDVRLMGFADLAGRMTHALAALGFLLLLVNLPLVAMGAVTVSWVAIAVLVAAPSLSALLQLGLSRTREYHADIGAAELTGDPSALASALAKMERYQGRVLERILWPRQRVPEPSLLRTHPPTSERIARLMSLSEAGLGPALPWGVYRGSRPLPLASSTIAPRWRRGGVWF